MKHFGTWELPPPVVESTPITEVPVGEMCGSCLKAIQSTDRGYLIPLLERIGSVSEVPYHELCFIHMVVAVGEGEE